MKNKNSFNKLYEQPSYVLEIRLNYETWNKIRWVASYKKSSYSWVVRYSLFRLIKRRNLKRFLYSGTRSKKFEKIHNGLLEDRKNSERKHRHRLCLYGEDELFVKLIAMKMRCSVTYLVRLALAFYLNELMKQCSPFKGFRYDNGIFSLISWYWLGIKLFQGVKLPNLNITKQHFTLVQFKKNQYW